MIQFRSLIIICFFISIHFLQGQSLVLIGGGAWQASNGGIVTNPTNINAIYTNPASLSSLDSKWGFDVGVERRFNLSELSTFSGGGFFKIDNSVIGASIVRYGYEDYTEQKIGFTYSRKLFNNFNIGSNFNVLQYRLNEFGNKTVLSFDIGLLTKISDNLSIGSVLNNPASSRLLDDRDLPVRISVGTNYQPSKKVNWIVELEKIIDEDLTIKSAILYYPVESLSLRIGGDFNRNLIGFGVLYNIQGLNVTGGYSYNSILGNYPSVSLGYQN